MDHEQAWTRLKLMTAAASAPVLEPDEIEVLLQMHRIADANGVAPGSASTAGLTGTLYVEYVRS